MVRKKATFNLDESTHQRLKLSATVQKREMVELVEEALGIYLEWKKMTKTEKNELELYRIAERSGPGRATDADFLYVAKTLNEPHEVLAQLLEYLDGQQYLVVEVNENKTGLRPFRSFPEGKLCFYHGGAIRLQLTVPGRQRFEQLEMEEEWETRRPRVASWREKASAFRTERVSALAGGQALVPIAPGPKIVMHCIPLESFGTETERDIFALDGVNPMYWQEQEGGLRAWRMETNLEGNSCFDLQGELPSLAYTQIFRTGAIEAVRAGILSGLVFPKIIPSLSYERAVVTYVPHCFELMRRLGCEAPILLGISLVGVKGLKLADSRKEIEQDVLMLPEIMVEDLSIRPSSLLKPALDRVWNACGVSGSPYFDNAGNWVGQQRSKV
jgi:hypothetical protein